ncbi:MAG: hypothetical protein ABMA13_08310 [Chthoniobacteraceae bacterium]
MTWGIRASLCGLPVSTMQIVAAKTRGALATNWPPLLPLVVGAMLLLPEFLKAVSNGRDAPFMLGGMTHAALTCLLLPVFIAWLSLRMRRGALAAGLTIWFVGNWIVGAVCAVMFDQGCLMILPIISGTLLVMLSADIPRQIERLAAEE